jgi:hypothetical protein
MRTFNLVNRRGTLLLGLCAVASLASANTVLYSTDGTATPGFNSANGYGSYAGSNATAAMFVPTASGILGDVVAATGSVGNGAFQEGLELRQDDSGAPGTLIDTITIPNSPTLVTALSTTLQSWHQRRRARLRGQQANAVCGPRHDRRRAAVLERYS